MRVENGSQFQNPGPTLPDFSRLANALALLAAAALAPPAGAPASTHALRPQSAAAQPHTTTVRLHRETYVMGTRLEATVLAPTRDAASTALEAAFREVGRLDGVLSSWRTDAELARLNRTRPGRPVPVSTDLYRWLTEARAWSLVTDGAFDPAVGALIDVWDLRGIGRRPTVEELAAALDRTGIERFEVRGGAAVGTEASTPMLRPTVTRARAGAWISAGAFGKGAALRAAGSRLRSAGLESALLDFGGQILARGGGPSGAGWEVAIAHPARRSEPVAWLRLRDRSVATTGASERHVKVTGERQGHVLDPRTGRPVPAWGSVTVIAEDPVAADILSTALFVMGVDAGMGWLEARDLPEVGAVFAVDRPGGLELRWTHAAKRWRVDPPGRARPGGPEVPEPEIEIKGNGGK